MEEKINIENDLILIKGEDRTKDISSCVLENDKYIIKFGKGQPYTYNYNKVQWLKGPECFCGSSVVAYQDNIPLSGVDKIYDFGEYIKIFFTYHNYSEVYKSQDLEVKFSCLDDQKAKKILEYLKQIAECIKADGDKEDGFLAKQYEKHLSFVSPDSVLAKYLNIIDFDKNELEEELIYPFGLNLSQAEATEKALTESISVIEGPPGTGKTQTILNILANAIFNDKKVAIVSNNNSATENVLEKLEKYGVDFLAAALGNNDNKAKFFDNQKQYPDFANWKQDITDYTKLKDKANQSGKRLKKMFKAKNKVAILKQNLPILLAEKKYFETRYKDNNLKILPYQSFFKHNSDTVLDFWVSYQQSANDKKIKFPYKLKAFFAFGVFSFSFYKNSNDSIIHFFQKIYYKLKENEMRNQIQELENKLKKFQFDEKTTEYSKDCMKIFKAKLAEKFSKNAKRPLFTKDDLWKQSFKKFIEEYPVISSTTHSLKSSIQDNYLFDYVIMDEASQIDIVTGALAFSCAKKAVIVGDLKQLPNVVTDEIKDKTNDIFDKYSINIAYHYAKNSILSSIIKLYPNIPKTLLKEHYRCHPMIIGFCNQKFYDNKLVILTEANERKNPLIVHKTVAGNHQRGRVNQRQIDVIQKAILPKLKEWESVGIITPYRDQTNAINEAIVGIAADTVHKYQGREKDVIIITTVDNEIKKGSFADDPNLVNVAVSRAVEQLIVVINGNEKNANSNIGDLVKYIEYNNFEIIQSDISSVFDLLYKSYNKQLLAFRKRRKRVSEYDSENLMSEVVENILQLPEFCSLDYVMNQPLKMIIHNTDKLDDKEYKFAMNILTHTDFLIFNKMDKMPILVVEVDGYAFHANNPIQLKRDKMKDTILKKYKIPILRLPTTGSNEQKRLKEELMKIQSN